MILRLGNSGPLVETAQFSNVAHQTAPILSLPEAVRSRGPLCPAQGIELGRHNQLAIKWLTVPHKLCATVAQCRGGGLRRGWVAIGFPLMCSSRS